MPAMTADTGYIFHDTYSNSLALIADRLFGLEGVLVAKGAMFNYAIFADVVKKLDDEISRRGQGYSDEPREVAFDIPKFLESCGFGHVITVWVDPDCLYCERVAKQEGAQKTPFALTPVQPDLDNVAVESMFAAIADFYDREVGLCIAPTETFEQGIMPYGSSHMLLRNMMVSNIA